MRKICVITGTRAEYGLLSGLMKAIKEDDDLYLQVIATNMHLSPEFGLTYREIENDGFYIDKKVQMLLSSDTSNATAKSVGLGMIGFADAYEDLKPDIIVILGDRFEILGAVSTALFYKIPVAHLHGGEITEGAYDDCIRHAITKMSHLHFTSTEEYRKRVIQLGEQPDHVFYVGAIGVENIRCTEIMTKKELEESLDFQLGNKLFLVTYHPVTLDDSSAAEQCSCLLEALDNYPDYRIIFTLPNSDTDGHVIISLVNDYVSRNFNRCKAFFSLGKKCYLSALCYTTAVIGNSSSGILEVPSFGIPTLNIGNRQAGRICADSVCHCGTDTKEILDGLQTILEADFIIKSRSVSNPYEKVGTVDAILEQLRKYPLGKLVKKTFYNL